MTTFCSRNCYDIFNLLSEYANHKNEEKRIKVSAELREKDLSSRDKFSKSANRYIDEIFGRNAEKTNKTEVKASDKKETAKAVKTDSKTDGKR